MATLEQRLESFAERAAAVDNHLNTNIGDLTSLTTTAKTSTVAAINENKAAIDAIPAAGSIINDTTPSTTTVYSSTKTDAQVATAVANLVDSAPGTLDTLNELAVALQGNDTDIAAILTAQTANTTAITANSTSITANAASIATLTTNVGDTDQDLVAVFNQELNFTV